MLAAFNLDAIRIQSTHHYKLYQREIASNYYVLVQLYRTKLSKVEEKGMNCTQYIRVLLMFLALILSEQIHFCSIFRSKNFECIHFHNFPFLGYFFSYEKIER